VAWCTGDLPEETTAATGRHGTQRDAAATLIQVMKHRPDNFGKGKMTEKAKKKYEIDWTREDCISEIVAQEILRDADYNGDVAFAGYYESLTKKERAKVDDAFLNLCGWELKTIIEAVQQHRLPEEVIGEGT
jgi:hypothetical protein